MAVLIHIVKPHLILLARSAALSGRALGGYHLNLVRVLGVGVRECLGGGGAY